MKFDIVKALLRLSKPKEISLEEKKYSYFIVKPNGIRHFQTYVESLMEEKFRIEAYYPVMDYAEINIALHPTKLELRHILPINEMFKILFGNYGILIVVSKENILYEDLMADVYRFKVKTRQQFLFDEISIVYDTSKILGDVPNERLAILDENGREIPSSKSVTNDFTHKGAFEVFYPNSLHSPDESVEVNIAEMRLLQEKGLFEIEIPDSIIENVIKYQTFKFLEDLF